MHISRGVYLAQWQVNFIFFREQHMNSVASALFDADYKSHEQSGVRVQDGEQVFMPRLSPTPAVKRPGLINHVYNVIGP